MKKTSIFALAVFIFTFSFSLFAQDDRRATVEWRVTKYDINATLPSNPADRNLSARAVLNLQNIGNAAGSRVTLRINEKAEITSVTANGAAANFAKSEERLGNRTVQRAAVSVPSVQPNGNLTVTVDYKIRVDENSGVNSIAPGNSVFLPLSFWYPTPNNHFAPRGADYAPFRLNVTAPAGETVVSTGKATGNSFEQTLNSQPFFATGNWDAVESNGVTVYLPKGAGTEEKKRADELAVLTVAARSFVSGLLDSTSTAPLKIVSVNRGAGFADGGTILLDYGVFKRDKVDSQTALRIAESVAKTVLGNTATIRNEGYGVIREGLSRFIATQFLEKQYGKDIADIERMRQRTAYAAVAIRDAPLNLSTPLDDFYYSAVSNKGAMIWRLLAKELGEEQFWSVVRNQVKSGNLTLTDLRAGFPSQKSLLDYLLDQPTDMNLLAGIPQQAGAETKVALRNMGAIPVTVNVAGTNDKGEKLTTSVTIAPKSFGEARFQTSSKIVRAEIDPEKFYPQTDFSDDIAPRDFNESDAIAVIKRAYDKKEMKEYATAEKAARTVLRYAPRFDDARMWLGRALLAQGKTAEAEKEFRAVLDEKLPSAQSLAWANTGLGEIALQANQASQAIAYFNRVVESNAEAGAIFNARAARNKAQPSGSVDDSIRAFFAQFDKAATSGRKSEMDAMILPGEMTRFSTGIGGQAQAWETNVLQTDKIDADRILAEVALNIRLLNKDPESGTAIFQLTRVGGVWKLSGVESFEVK